MKLSDYVADFIRRNGGQHVFVVSGGASLHLIHSVNDTKDLEVVCMHHEQAAAMAADAYARDNYQLGVAIATSGPGATNLITGICCSYFDSIPTLFITGQVATFRSSAGTDIRQIGFQETDIVDIVEPVTKYATRVTKPEDIRYELEKAIYTLREGRPGPVLVDIPDDLQRSEINPSRLLSFEAAQPPSPPVGELIFHAKEIVSALQTAKRPVIVAGWGIRLSGAQEAFVLMAERLGVPVLPTWGMADILPDDHRLRVGTFGTHGTRSANFCVQNCDLLFSIGSRLDTHVTGSPLESFARGARKIIVDIDDAELGKFQNIPGDGHMLICGDVGIIVSAILDLITMDYGINLDGWFDRIQGWKNTYPQLTKKQADEITINPYYFVDTLGFFVEPNALITCDTGCAIAWMMQGFRFKHGQRFYHAFNNTPMGYAIPAAIAKSLAHNNVQVICVTGDGSLQMNIQELATLVHLNLPIKIFVLNNDGYSMIRQTQDQWLESKYIASSREGGISMPNFSKIAEGYSIPSVRVDSSDKIDSIIKNILNTSGPVLCDVIIPPEHRVIPQVKYGRPIEDSEPLLTRKEFSENMIVPALKLSQG